jgi:putative ABC transport system permease protein
MMRGFVRLTHVDPGFRTAHILTAAVPPNRTGRPTQAELTARYGAILAAAQRVPGVEQAAITSALPLGRIGVAIDFRMPERSPDAFRVQYHAVSADYFSVLGIPLKSGRFFDARDTGTSNVVIVNEAMARQYWPGQDPVGRPFGDHALTIVGVAGNTHLRELSGELVPEVYEPYQQFFGPAPGATLVLRTYGEPATVVSGLRRAIHDFDPEQVLESVTAMDGLVSNSVGQSRFYTSLMFVFAFLAVTLTLIGVYGVASYATDRRAREMGIRMAIGAQPGLLVAMIVRQGFTGVALGIAAGIAGAWMLARLMAGMVYGVPVRDTVSLGIAAGILSAGALAAYFVPARRITRIDPAALLREQ